MAIHRRLSIPAEPFIDPDIWGYLGSALHRLHGEVFASRGREFVYPGFLYLILSASHHFAAITRVQHLVGIGTGLVLLANWMAARRLLPQPAIPRPIHAILGLAMLGTFLLSSEAMTDEHHLRPESISPFFAVLGYYFIVQFLVAKYRDKNSTKTLIFGAASIGTALLLPMFKPSYWLSTFLTTIPVWWHLFDSRETLWRRLLCTAGPVIAAALLLWLPEKHFASLNTGERGAWDESVFMIHALQIREQIAADAAIHPPDLKYRPETIDAVLRLLDTELKLSQFGKPEAVASLGFDPDYLLYEDSFYNKLLAIVPTIEGRAAFCRYYYLRTWRERPGSMFAKVGKQLASFYGWRCPVYHAKNVPLNRHYAKSLEVFEGAHDPGRYRSYATISPELREYAEAIKRLAQGTKPVKQPWIVGYAAEILSDTYLIELLLFAALTMVLLVSAPERNRLGLFWAAVAVGYAYNFGNTLGISLLHSLWVGRYSRLQFATTVLVQFQMVILAGEALLRARVRAATSIPVSTEAGPEP